MLVAAVLGIQPIKPAEVPLPPPAIKQIEIERAANTPAGLENIVLASSTLEIGGEATSTEEKPLCSCVQFVREKTGYSFPKVDSAKDIIVNKLEPQVGGIAVFNAGGIYGAHGHTSYILSVATSTFEVIEFNFKPCQITKRTIAIDDPKIKGYFSNKF